VADEVPGKEARLGNEMTGTRQKLSTTGEGARGARCQRGRRLVIIQEIAFLRALVSEAFTCPSFPLVPEVVQQVEHHESKKQKLGPPYNKGFAIDNVPRKGNKPVLWFLEPQIL
jgi:hypothetical protein